MWFKNATLLRLPQGHEVGDLEAALSERQLQAPGPLELDAQGFVTPFPVTLTHQALGATLLCLGKDTRLLPASVLRDAVAERVSAHVEKTGQKPGKRLRNEFREAALGELLPRAFIVHSRTMAYIDGRTLVVDSASASAAEDVATALREALGTFPARPVAAESSATLLMSEWLAHGELPDGLSLGDQVVLEDPSDQESVIAGKRCDLGLDEIREHVRGGMQVTQLGLIFEDRIGFVLDRQLRLRKLEFLDIVTDELGRVDGEDEATVLDAEYTLMVGELHRLIARLDEVLRFVD